jgi:hypothetical protein
MIKLTGLLKEIGVNEAITDKVWHFTSLVSLAGILDKNKFELSRNESKSANKPTYKKYYMSLSRVRSGGYPERSSRCISARVELDGRKLSQSYKGAATAYFSDTRTRDEFEDRLFSDKQYIDNASDYIKKIDFWPNQCISRTDWPISQILDECIEKNIELNYYSTKQKYYGESGGIRVTKENREEVMKRFMASLSGNEDDWDDDDFNGNDLTKDKL